MPKDDGLQRCHLCGCTEFDPCQDEATGNAPCGWSFKVPDLCTACEHDPLELVGRLAELRQWCDETLAAAGPRLAVVAAESLITYGRIHNWLRAHGYRINQEAVKRILSGERSQPMGVFAIAIALKALSETRANDK